MVSNVLRWDADEKGIDKTRLAMLLYLVDFVWYYTELTPMSGVGYRRLPLGPVPDVYFRIVDELTADGLMATDRLSEDEAAFIKKIVESWRGRQTQEIVDYVCQQLPWRICRGNEIIPYCLITQEDPEKIFGVVKL